MKNDVLINLDDIEKQAWKQKVLLLRKKKFQEKENIIVQKKLEQLEKNLLENRKLLDQLYNKDKSKKYSLHYFDDEIRKHEIERNVLKIEIAVLEGRIITTNNFIKRLNCILLLLNFSNEVIEKEVSVKHGQVKKVSLEEGFYLFFEHLLKEKKQSLELKQKILQLHILFNSPRYGEIPSDQKYFMTSNEKKKCYEEIIISRDEILELEKNFSKLEHIDCQKVLLSDVLNENIDFVYDKIFREDIVKKRDIK